MDTREQEVLEKSLELLVRVLSPKKIYLFGSRAKEKAQSVSDFDFAVDVPLPDRRKKREIKDLLEKISGLYTVDVIYLKEAESGFKDLILKTGKIIYEQK